MRPRINPSRPLPNHDYHKGPTIIRQRPNFRTKTCQLTKTREVKFVDANDQVIINLMTFGYQVYLYSFPLRRFGVGGEVPVVKHEPIFGRAFVHFQRNQGDKNWYSPETKFLSTK